MRVLEELARVIFQRRVLGQTVRSNSGQRAKPLYLPPALLHHSDCLRGVTNHWNITVVPVNFPVRHHALESHAYWLEIKLLRELGWIVDSHWIQYTFQPLLFQGSYPAVALLTHPKYSLCFHCFCRICTQPPMASLSSFRHFLDTQLLKITILQWTVVQPCQLKMFEELPN